MPHWNSRNFDPGFDITPPGPVRNFDPGFDITPPGPVRNFDPGFDMVPDPWGPGGSSWGMPREGDPDFDPIKPGHIKDFPGRAEFQRRHRLQGHGPSPRRPYETLPGDIGTLPGRRPYETLPGDIGTLPGRSGGNSSFILYAKQQLDEALELYQQVFQNSANGAGVKE